MKSMRLYRTWLVLMCGAAIAACTAPQPQRHSQRTEDIRNIVGAIDVVDEVIAIRFFTGIEAYQRGDFTSACSELGRLYRDYPIATLQFAALSAEGRCADISISPETWQDVVDYKINQQSVVERGICGASLSGCSVSPLEYAEAAAWDRAGLLSEAAGVQYYMAKFVWDRWRLFSHRSWDEVRLASIHWMRLAADAGNPAAQLALGEILIRGGSGAKDGVQAGYGRIEAAAAQGFPPAQYAIAERYFYGREIAARDLSRAADWYRRAAEHGHTRAQYSLGVQYRTGQGVERDEGEALKWFILAARSKNPAALRARNELLASLPSEQISLARAAVIKWTQENASPQK